MSSILNVGRLKSSSERLDFHYSRVCVCWFSYFSSPLINFLAEDVDTVLPVENAHNVDSVDVGMCPYLLPSFILLENTICFLGSGE